MALRLAFLLALLAIAVSASDDDVLTNFDTDGEFDASDCTLALGIVAFKFPVLSVGGESFRSTYLYHAPVPSSNITAPLVVMPDTLPDNAPAFCADFLSAFPDRVRGSIVAFPATCFLSGDQKILKGTPYVVRDDSYPVISALGARLGVLGLIFPLNVTSYRPSDLQFYVLLSGWNPEATVPSILLPLTFYDYIKSTYANATVDATLGAADDSLIRCQQQVFASLQFHMIGIPILDGIVIIAVAVILGFRIKWHFQRLRSSRKSKNPVNMYLLHASLIFLMASNVFWMLGSMDLRGYRGFSNAVALKAWDDLGIATLTTSVSLVIAFWIELIASKGSIWTPKLLRILVGVFSSLPYIIVLADLLNYPLNGDGSSWSSYPFVFFTLSTNTVFIVLGSIILRQLQWSEAHSMSPNLAKRRDRLRKLSIYLIACGTIGYITIFIQALYAFNAWLEAEFILYPMLIELLLVVYNIPMLTFLYTSPSSKHRVVPDGTTPTESDSRSPSQDTLSVMSTASAPSPNAKEKDSHSNPSDSSNASSFETPNSHPQSSSSSERVGGAAKSTNGQASSGKTSSHRSSNPDEEAVSGSESSSSPESHSSSQPNSKNSSSRGSHSSSRSLSSASRSSSAQS